MKKGFTLIELLVVVLIIGILSAVALPQYNKTVEKSRASELAIMMKSFSDAVRIYQLENPSTALTSVDNLTISFAHQNGNMFWSDHFMCYIYPSAMGSQVQCFRQEVKTTSGSSGEVATPTTNASTYYTITYNIQPNAEIVKTCANSTATGAKDNCKNVKSLFGIE